MVVKLEQLVRYVQRGVPVPLTDVERRAIETEANNWLWLERMDEGVCAVCDELGVRSELHDVMLTDGSTMVARMRTRLRAPVDIARVPELLAEYRVLGLLCLTG